MPESTTEPAAQSRCEDVRSAYLHRSTSVSGSRDTQQLANKVLLGLLIGVVAGFLTLQLSYLIPELLPHAQRLATSVLEPVGQVFLRMLFFVIIPIVFGSVALAVMQLPNLRRLGPLGSRTFLLFFLNMSIAVALGLLFMNLLQPGHHLGVDAKADLFAQYAHDAPAAPASSAVDVAAVTLGSIIDIFMPRNLVGAVAGEDRSTLGEVLPLILFAILVGAAGLSLSASRQAQLRDALSTVTELMTKIVHFALRLAPYAVPALVFSVVVKVGAEILITLAVFVAGCILLLLFHLFGTMSIWLRLLARRSPGQFFRAVSPALITAFSTSSSNATLPTALAIARERLRIRDASAGFVLPLGTTLNMSGTALYEGCVVLFVAQVFGVDLGLGQQLTLVLLSVTAAVAAAGIPGGSIPLIAGLLSTFGLPAEAIGIVLGVDRLMDMTRSMVNVGADLVTCAVIDRWEDPSG